MSTEQKKTLLVVDDNQINSFIVRRLVKASGLFAEPILKENGKMAYQYLKDADVMGNFPEVVILDLLMPEMDGLEFLELYEKEFASSYPDTTIFIYSVENPSRVHEKILHYNFVDSFIPKRHDGSFLKIITERLRSDR